MNRMQRIEHERTTLRPTPWEFVPSEVYRTTRQPIVPCPYPVSTVGAASWLKAQEQVREILRREPGYFRN